MGQFIEKLGEGEEWGENASIIVRQNTSIQCLIYEYITLTR